MSDYLSKEEIKQWRSSLEKITLEEFAARLGKRIEDAKPTKDMADVVMYDSGMPVMQRLSSIAERAMEVEKRIAPTPFTNIKKEEPANVTELKGKFAFTKALTDREQKVFDFLLENNGKIVYAKDIADLLELPRDYIYKYIKNLRSKIEGDKLQNADKSGFVLNL
jgi:hypothetical protein